LKAARAQRSARPVYRPDRARNHFFLFRSLQQKRQENNWVIRDDLITQIGEMFGDIDRRIWIFVYRSLIRRLKRVIKEKRVFQLITQKSQKVNSDPSRKVEDINSLLPDAVLPSELSHFAPFLLLKGQDGFQQLKRFLRNKTRVNGSEIKWHAHDLNNEPTMEFEWER
jgi:hypothetical protein